MTADLGATNRQHIGFFRRSRPSRTCSNRRPTRYANPASVTCSAGRIAIQQATNDGIIHFAFLI